MNKYKMLIAAVATIFSFNASAQKLTVSDLTVAPNSEDTIDVKLESSVVAAAGQFNIALPDGVELQSVERGGLVADGDWFQTKEVDGGTRLVINASNAVGFPSASGTLARLAVKVGELADGDYEAKITDVKFADKDAKSIKSGSSTLDDVVFKITVDATATGIDKVTLDDINSGRVEVYNLQGQKVANPRHGVYIVNGRKVILK